MFYPTILWKNLRKLDTLLRKYSPILIKQNGAR